MPQATYYKLIRYVVNSYTQQEMEKKESVDTKFSKAKDLWTLYTLLSINREFLNKFRVRINTRYTYVI